MNLQIRNLVIIEIIMGLTQTSKCHERSLVVGRETAEDPTSKVPNLAIGSTSEVAQYWKHKWQCQILQIVIIHTV